MANIQFIKKQVFFLFVLCSFSIVVGMAQSDTIKLEELIVSGKSRPNTYYDSTKVLERITRDEILAMPGESINEVLESITLLDVRERGSIGIQADVNFRGGSFDQVLILLNGVKINNPQTGHHHLNIPVDIQDIERIEVLKGAGAQMLAPGAFSGAINIITRKPEDNNQLHIGVKAGENKYYNTRLSGNYAINDLSNYLSLSDQRSEGYIDNTDFKSYNAFYQAHVRTSAGPFNLQIGHSDKRFGANSFYTPAFPDQYEHIRSSLMHASFVTGKNLKVIPHLYFQRHQDRFELFRNNAPAWYSGHNYHLTTVQGGDIHLRYVSSLGISSLSTSYNFEKIYSNILGIPLGDTLQVPFEKKGQFTHSTHRDNLNINLNHRYDYKNISLAMGILVNKVRGYDWKIYGGSDFNWVMTKLFTLHGSVYESLRLPTFTELYYSGPTNTGNPGLRPEKAINIESGVGFRQNDFSIDITGFYRMGKNIIDWIKQSDTIETWQTINHTKINALGFDISGKIKLNNLIDKKIPFKFIRTGYTYVDNTKDAGNMISRYVLDYMRSKVYASLYHTIYKGFSGSWKYTFQDRAGSYTDYKTGQEKAYSPFSLLDVKLSWSKQYLNVFIDVSNLLNTKYQDISNVPMPGRWIKGGVNVLIK